MMCHIGQRPPSNEGSGQIVQAVVNVPALRSIVQLTALIGTLSCFVCLQQGNVRAQDVLSRSEVSAADRQLALAQLWREARDSFAYYTRLAQEWDRLYQQFVPRVAAATTDYAYYLELMRFYAHLNDGHSGVFWPAAFDEALGYPPLEIRPVDGRAVIVRLLRDTDELQRLGIRPGLAVTQIDNRPVAELVDYWRALKTGSTRQATDRLAYFRILTGPRNSMVSVVVEEPGGASRPVQLTRSERYFNDTNLDPPVRHVSRTIEPGIAYFQANQMRPDVGDAFAKFIDSAADLKGLILDLRYNGGGSDQVSFDMVSRLIDQPVNGPIYEVTSYRPDRRAERAPQEVIRTQPRVAPAAGRRFLGPLIVLIGTQTHSATESGFVAVIRQRPDTTLMGEPTAGSTGQPLVFPLPGNAVGVVCSRRSLTPDGREFVGVGFTPDVSAHLTQEDLFLNRDSTLDSAIARLRSR